ncbi:elymoclavine monooxygenase [Trichoderma arundinaceum]|uniref:Elymoclavine monooxygenase n=1 Tax=Trichoderma arundinaceum TaxID=490622 RepID=A0A395NFA0_TRIAR|nr:elymoclavine monooxygenase [Trichoderma arundinaceum]
MDVNSTKTTNTITEQEGVMWLWLSRLYSVSLVAFCFTLLATALVLLISTIIYRLYIHPLRKIPGPRLAALTDVYGFYWNWAGEGYCKLFNPLHQKYRIEDSQIVRIGPNHVHVDQPAFFDEAFKAGSAWLKDASFYKHFGGVDTMIEPIEYRTYRTHLAPLYSQRSIDRLVPKLHQCLMMAGEQMFTSSGKGSAANMTSILRTLSADMILHIIFSQDISLSDYEGYHPFLESCDVLMRYTWMMLNYPLVAMVLGIIPGTGFAKLTNAFNEFMKLIINDDSNVKIGNSIKKKFIPYPLEDIFNFVAGGSDTTSYTTACALFHVLSSPDVLSKLVKELDEASQFIREEFDYKKIQNLPYLNAIINETLRISSPVPGCNPRVVPKGGTTLDSIYLPAGTKD